MLTKSHEEGVWLRWSPKDVVAWQLGNQYGYTLERIAFQMDGDIAPGSKTMLTIDPIKHATEVVMQELAKTSDEIGVLHTLIFDKTFNNTQQPNGLAAIIKRNNDLENRFGIAMLMCDLSREAAHAGGFHFVDKTAEKGMRYAYRVSIATSTVESDPAVATVTYGDKQELLEITDLNVEFSDRKATLAWSTQLHKEIYTAYYIERSTDGKIFNRISDLPYVHMTEDASSTEVHYIDSLTNNQSKVYYRIKGVTPFAEKGPYSNVVSGKGEENITGLLIIREGKANDQRNVSLQWEFPAALENQIHGFYVASGSHPDGPFVDIGKKMLAKNIRSLVQTTPFANTYYVVRAVDKAGKEVARSFPYLVQIADVTPPAVPVRLVGSIDTNGVVMLTWMSNSDTDIMGYRVFRSNSLKEEFVEITKGPIESVNFKDSVNINVLNKSIYYTIISVDRNYNTSDYAPPLHLKRPDIIAPAAPVITHLDVVKDTLILEWANSISDDVARYELIRKDIAERLSRPLITWTAANPLTTYQDIGLTPTKKYQYTVIVYDSAGNSSQTQSRIVYYEPGFRPAVTNIQGAVNRETRTISLKWTNGQPAVKCIIYRKTNDSPFKIIDTLEGSIENYSDKRIMANNEYTYKIQAVYTKGVKSIISKELKVAY